MTDYRDPNYRDPIRPGYRGSGVDSTWSTATWGWIAGISVVVLILIFAFGMSTDRDRTATESTTPPVTSGQRTLPPTGTPSQQQAPSMNPAPSETVPATPPTKQ